MVLTILMRETPLTTVSSRTSGLCRLPRNRGFGLTRIPSEDPSPVVVSLSIPIRLLIVDELIKVDVGIPKTHVTDSGHKSQDIRLSSPINELNEVSWAQPS